ncbi:hypothetical protein [Legionella cardiaca]|uniref:Capsule polysaccharide biosynthesis protein n=1 Tax=Legionella cardiaca TaxID=1071983 RepID=A0ABY8AQU1_9GAMM|nr:hypothetical protein [Legionella cardiaca]WED41890.1 hypothetical protein PXX05_08070 [Legionella cardiaca]
MTTPKNTLLFVHISTHFKEIIRVARLMKAHHSYVPIVFFDAEYEGSRKDIALCEAEGIDVILFFEKTYTPPQRKLWLRILRFGIRKCLFFLQIFKYLKMPFPSLKLNKLKFKSKKKFKAELLPLKKRKKFSADRFQQPSLKASNTSKYLLAFYRLIWKRFPQFLPAISRAAREYCAQIPDLLLKHNIKLMVFPEHNLFYFTQIFVYFGRKYNIPSIIVPFTIANTLEWAEAFYDDPSRSLEQVYNRICADAFPHWVHVYKGRPLILPVEIVLLHEMLKITPKNPWLLNSGDIDFLALESDAMKDYYVTAGIEEKHLRATGALCNDDLYFRLQQAEIHRKALYESLNFTSDKPMILCALPPDQCASRKKFIEFEDFEETVRFVISELSKYSEQYNIVINLHPRIKPSSVDYINEYPVKIFYGDIAEVIPLSAIYMAVSSATIRMAITCGIPVINYDLYRYRYDDYANLDGVLTLFDKKEFILTLEKLTKQNNFYEKIKSAQIEKSGLWGKLDGQAGKNLLSEINLLYAG